MGKQNKKMQKLTNFLFLTILICAHITINTKTLKSQVNKTQKGQNTEKIRPTSAPQQKARTETQVDPVLAKPKVAAPVTKNKFSKKNKTAAPKKKVTPPKKNKKLGQNKKNRGSADAAPKAPKKPAPKKAAPKKKKANKKKAAKKNNRKNKEAEAPKKSNIRRNQPKPSKRERRVEREIEAAASVEVTPRRRNIRRRS